MQKSWEELIQNFTVKITIKKYSIKTYMGQVMKQIPKRYSPLYLISFPYFEQKKKNDSYMHDKTQIC